jgi:phosphate-selective porin OprO/OprP
MLIAMLVCGALPCAKTGPPATVGSYGPGGGQNADAVKKPQEEQSPEQKGSRPAPDAPIDPDEDRGNRGARFVWNQHPSFRYGSVFRIDFQAKFQEDARASYPDAPELMDPLTGEKKTFDLHRNRIGVQGHVFRRIEYEIERELTERELSEREIDDPTRTNESAWKDVFVNVSYIDNAQFQVGRFKIPFGLDRLTPVTQNDFVYRSLGARYLAPGRDIGATVHGRFFRRGLSYWAGVFEHDGDNARSSKIAGGDRTFATRLSGTPFRKLGIPGLELGTALTVSELSDESFRPNGLRGRTVMTEDTFFEPVYVKGRRQRWEGDVDWTAGPLSARGEYTHVIDQRLGQGLGDDDLPDALARSWYVSGTWIVTGEDKERPVVAARDFLRGGIGAVEVAGRYERLWFESVGEGQAFRNPRAEHLVPSGDRVLTVGVNWTLNRFVKLQVNAIRERVEDADRSPVPNGDPFWSRVFRLQLVL